MALNETFDSEGPGTGALFVEAGASVTFDLSGTFSAAIALQRAVGGGAAWESVLVLRSASSGEYQNDGSAQRYRWACIEFTSGEAAVESDVAAPPSGGSVSPDDIDGATTIGKALLTAANAGAALDAIGAAPNTAATESTAGLVQMGAAVADATDAEDVVDQFNALLGSLRGAGVLAE